MGGWANRLSPPRQERPQALTHPQHANGDARAPGKDRRGNLFCNSCASRRIGLAIPLIEDRTTETVHGKQRPNANSRSRCVFARTSSPNEKPPRRTESEDYSRRLRDRPATRLGHRPVRKRDADAVMAKRPPDREGNRVLERVSRPPLTSPCNVNGLVPMDQTPPPPKRGASPTTDGPQCADRPTDVQNCHDS